MTNPHDEFARFIFSDLSCAEAELRRVLPPEVVPEVDWSTLQREPDVKVEPALRKSESTLCFSARFFDREPVRFILVLKSKSTPEDRWMALRMMRYVLDDLENWRKAHPESTLPPDSFPALVYFGKSPWTAPRRLDELFDLPRE
jgi:predicted transposase YdaD